MTTYSDELATTICEALAEGEGLWAICNRLNIPRTNVLRWEESYPEFGARVRQARRWGHDKWAEEIISLSDSSRGLDMAGVQSSRLMVDRRKFILGKLRPELFGDKIELTGRDGKDLLPSSPDVLVPRLMQVLAVLLPGSANAELHTLASTMVARLNGKAAQLTSESEDGTHED